VSTYTFKVGDKVTFGRLAGEQTLGTVIKVNSVKLKVRQDETRGALRTYPIGTIWTVPPSLCRKVGQTSTTPAPVVDALTLKVGDAVQYEGFSWAARGKATIKGVVTKLGQGAYEVYGEGRTQVLQAAQVKAVGKRDFETVKGEISGVYSHLSPENLWSDGEATRTEANRRRACLNRALAALFIEAGRRVSEEEAFPV
jgi:co-chaperonin GroES (HSP10)